MFIVAGLYRDRSPLKISIWYQDSLEIGTCDTSVFYFPAAIILLLLHYYHILLDFFWIFIITNEKTVYQMLEFAIQLI